jgi:hypothetical protein
VPTLSYESGAKQQHSARDIALAASRRSLLMSPGKGEPRLTPASDTLFPPLMRCDRQADKPALELLIETLIPTGRQSSD